MKIKVKILGVDCYYDGYQALDNISFEVCEGDFLGVIGPNGSGKTTLLRCITKALKPEKGVILLDGEDVLRVERRDIAKNVSVVPQDSNLKIAFNVSDFVLMGRTPYLDGLSSESEKDLKIAENSMRLTKTSHLADKTIKELSGGEKQRVVIAKSLAQEPELLILDEPTLHLDINHQLEILKLMKRLNKKNNLTLIAVLHDLNLAARFCNKLLLLDDGRIQSMGAVEDVLKPENIKAAFNVEVHIDRHPLKDYLNITVIS